MCLGEVHTARALARARRRRGAPRGRFAAAGTLGAALLALAGCGGGEAQQTTAPAVTGAPAAAAAEAQPDAGTAADARNEPAPDPETDRVAIARTLRRVLGSGGARAACDELVTPHYVRDSFGDAAGCRAAQAPGAAARRVAVSRVVVLPDSVAQAWVRPRGGVHDGERLRAELVLDDGVWRLDSLRSNVPVGP